MLSIHLKSFPRVKFGASINQAWGYEIRTELDIGVYLGEGPQGQSHQAPIFYLNNRRTKIGILQDLWIAEGRTD